MGSAGTPLSPEAEGSLREASLVVGGERHLEDLSIEPGHAAVLKGDLSEALARIEEAEGLVAVLSSGDPGFFGIVRLLGERFGPKSLRVFPAVSSVSFVSARAPLHWDDATTACS